jgi:hypothetical protein
MDGPIVVGIDVGTKNMHPGCPARRRTVRILGWGSTFPGIKGVVVDLAAAQALRSIEK